MFSKRIETISKKIKPFQTFSDVGCDHGYLIIEAILNNDIKRVIGIDNKKGPLSQAQLNVNKYLSKEDILKVELKLSHGISEIDESIECVVIAGMGTETIIKIIEDSLDKLQNIKRFIIDSHKDIYKLRKFISNLGYQITDEEIVEENQKFYEIITFDKTVDIVKYNECELQFGPILLSNKGDLFFKKWNNELQKFKKIFEKENNKVVYQKIKEIEAIL